MVILLDSIDPIIKKMIMGDEEPIGHRPADDIPPQMEKMAKNLAEAGYPNATKEDILSYALFPDVALTYFGKHRCENPVCPKNCK